MISLKGFGGRKYDWHGPREFYAATSTVTFAAFSKSQSGTYTLVVTDSVGCKNSTSTVVTIYEAPGGGLWGSQNSRCVPFCSDFKLIPNANTGKSIISTNWYLNDEAMVTDSAYTFNYCFKAPGVYTLRGVFTDGHCSGTSTFAVNAWKLPDAGFNYQPERPVENSEQVVFINTSIGNDSLNQLTEFSWHIRDKHAEVSDKAEHTSYYFSEAGIYPVAMVVTSNKGCSDTIIKLVTVLPDFSVYIPNAFTPDDDGNNERFYPVTRNLKLLNFSVFDRWGAMLFSTDDPATGWDGTFHGQPCKQDVYQWKLEVSGKEGELKKMNGNVTLLR
jgi:gliding motility-associated-like protein